MTEAGTLTPSQITIGLAALIRLRDASERARGGGDGPDMSRPTATAADFAALVSI